MPVLNIGLPDSFIEQGTREELLAVCGLDAHSILTRVEAFCA
jgi:1-deoxy-D-xylulose-5-phosphate synthase